VLPNFYIWWDRALKDKVAPSTVTARFATRAYAALFRRALGVQGRPHAAPKAGSIAVITMRPSPTRQPLTYQRSSYGELTVRK